MGNPTQSLRALIRPANYLLWTVVSLSLLFDMYMFASWKQDFDYISHILFQVNLNEATVVYLLRRRPKACLLKHLFSPPWTTFSTETSLVFSRRRPQTRPGCLRSLLLNRRTTTWNLFVLDLYNKETYYFSFFLSKSFSITRKPAFAHLKKKAIWHNLLSIQNEAISLVAMHSKELWLVQKNHATVKLDSYGFSSMNTYSESRKELRGLQILKKMLEK